MDENRKQTIIKRNLLLERIIICFQTHYCDFLISLYTEGKDVQENKVN